MKKESDNPLRRQIIRRLQQAILDSGMPYHQIAEKLGTHTDVIASYMKREPRIPSVEMLARLCPVLGVSADRVVLGEEDIQK